MTTQTISRTDYNAIRATINVLLGTGTASRGYGQPLGSVALPDPPTPVVIQDEQWDALYYDLLNILIHQTGVIPIVPNVDSGEVVRLGASYPLSAYVTALSTADTNRFTVALNQSVIEGKGSASYSSAWSNQLQATVTVSFSTANEARWFFNSGGKVRISSSRAGGSVSAQNTSWTNMLTAAGVVEFGAGTSSSVNFYNLTDTYQTVALFTGSGYYLYSANTYRIEARSNVVDNSGGTATQVTLRITWADNYVDLKPSLPNDQVDGEISFSVEEQRASGFLKPDGFGAFSITGASYTISSISSTGITPVPAPPPPTPAPPPPPPPTSLLVVGGAGGIGLSSSITGTSTMYAGGGGGGGQTTGGIGGSGIGGNGGYASLFGLNGVSNRGGGGGGAGGASSPIIFGGNGGSGIVVIKYASTTGAIVSGSPLTNIIGGESIYTFVGSGNIIFPPGVTSAEYLVVAGGGGGGGSRTGGGGGGGGGAGGYRIGTLTVDSVTTYTVTIGSGGSGGPGTQNGSNGSNSTFASITAVGGGGGGGSNANGISGGSGGGGAGGTTTLRTGGAGTAGQGNSGGSSSTYGDSSGGGGGAGGAGGNPTA